MYMLYPFGSSPYVYIMLYDFRISSEAAYFGCNLAFFILQCVKLCPDQMNSNLFLYLPIKVCLSIPVYVYECLCLYMKLICLYNYMYI